MADMKISDNIIHIGASDNDLKLFESQYVLENGMAYNSYLIKDEKTVLIDTVWLPYDREFVSNVKKEIDLNKIDYNYATWRSRS